MLCITYTGFWFPFCGRKYRQTTNKILNAHEADATVQFSSVPWPNGSSGGHEGRFSGDLFAVFSAEGPCELFWHGQGVYSLWCCPSSTFSSADHGVAHPPRCPEGCRGVWHVRTMLMWHKYWLCPWVFILWRMKFWNRVDCQRSLKKIQNTQKIKRTLFNKTKQDKTCKFSM